MISTEVALAHLAYFTYLLAPAVKQELIPSKSGKETNHEQPATTSEQRPTNKEHLCGASASAGAMSESHYAYLLTLLSYLTYSPYIPTLHTYLTYLTYRTGTYYCLWVRLRKNNKA